MPRVVIKSTELEAKTKKGMKYSVERMKLGENTLLEDDSKSRIID